MCVWMFINYTKVYGNEKDQEDNLRYYMLQ